MRIVGGSARGRRLRAPPGGTRPTSERAREALFNRLATLLDLDGSRVLDLYAGSGAVGLEALSRGAAYVCFVESDRRAADVLDANIAAVSAGPPPASRSGPVETSVRRAAVETFLAGPPPGGPFDLIFADPPYALAAEAVTGLVASVATPEWCVSGGVVVVERPARGAAVTWPGGVQELASKRYGEGVLWYGRLP